jgi:hypothetical protein
MYSFAYVACILSMLGEKIHPKTAILQKLIFGKLNVLFYVKIPMQSIELFAIDIYRLPRDLEIFNVS